jgi:beta-lactamase regulating signal transducer with metallopeptidase domain
MTLEGILDGRIVNALGWALLQFVWQGALAALALAAAHSLVPRRSARLRYTLAAAALASMAVLPVLTFVGNLDLAQASETVTRVDLATTAGPVETAPALADAGLARGVRSHLAGALPVLVGAWGLGVALLSVRVIGGWTVAQRLARSGRPASIIGLDQALARLCQVMRVSRPVRLLESLRVEVPTVVGWMRPVILFPAATLVGLTPAQLEVVLAHELAHVRRLDYLVNLIQTAVETLLFYHPAVWWVSNRVRVEREHCCDDAAVAACGDALAYARALADLEGLRLSAAGLAMAADGGSLLQRVGRLVGSPPSHASGASRALGVLLAVVAVPAFLAGSGWMDARAQSQAEPAATAAPEAAAATEAVDAEGAAEGEAQAAAAEARPARRAPTKDAALSIEEVLELARAGVTPEYLDEMAAAGVANLSWEQVIELRSNGVSAEYVRGLNAEGYSGLSPERLVELRSNGVGPEFAKELREQGLEKLSLSNLLELRSQGVSADFVRELKEQGYGDLSPNALMNLRSEGVTPEYVRELKELGYRDLSTNKLVALRNQGVGPDYVRELKELGYDGLSVPVLLGLRSQGVTPDFVRDVEALGYDGLPPGMLIELRSQGVTPEFIKEIKEAGWANVTPEELIELRSQGVRGDLLRRLGQQPRPQGRAGEQR